MKPSNNIFRVLLLMIIFWVFRIGAIAQSPNIALNVVSDLTKGIALIDWTTNNLSIPGDYIIEREAGSTGLWEGIDTISNTKVQTTNLYNDTISSNQYCSPTNFRYRIKFKAALVSNNAITLPTAAIFLSDQTSPPNVVNLNVTIITTRTGSYPKVFWTHPITTDKIKGYDIQRYDGFSWPNVPLSTISANLSSFIDSTISNVCGTSYRYIIRTIDQCNHPSAPDYENKYAQTIKLDAAQPRQCDKSTELVWNSYKNLPGGLGGYTISRKEGTNPAIDFNVNDTSFIDYVDFKDGFYYSYSIRAYSEDGLYSSSSCKVGWKYNSAILPDTVYIAQVSVEDDSYINVEYYFSPVSTVTKLILERSDDNGSTFHAIDSIMSPVPQRFHFNDTTVDVHAQSYYYRLAVIDDCDNKSMSMNTCRSIWLQCTPSETQNTLDWNTYESWMQGVGEYDILRVLNLEPATIKTLATAGPATSSYSDLLTSFDSSKMPCYWVEAKENPGNPCFQNAVSKSNACCIIKDPIIFIPNAFYPDGLNNKLFRPVPDPSFIDTESFKMTIFNRWGQQLYETTDMKSGWDGSVNGQYTPAGQYVYLITYKSPEGKDYTKRGTVTLVR